MANKYIVLCHDDKDWFYVENEGLIKKKLLLGEITDGHTVIEIATRYRVFPTGFDIKKVS